MGPSFWQDLAGGTVGGVIGMTVVYPLDTVKCRQVRRRDVAMFSRVLLAGAPLAFSGAPAVSFSFSPRLRQARPAGHHGRTA